MDIRMVPIDDVVPYHRNPRVIEAAVPKVMASLEQFGWRQPIVVDQRMTIVVGHVRWHAARQLGMTEVPVHIADNLTPIQIKAYRLADNRTGEEATWADDLLRLELGDLKLDGFDLTMTGWDEAEINSLLTERTKGHTDPDAVPEPLEARVRQGDIWRLGDHTLYCADCQDVLPDLCRADALITDPPFGIGFGYDQHDDSDYGDLGYGAWIWHIVEAAERILPAGAPVFVWQAPENIRSLATWFPRDWRLYCGARNFTQMGRGTVMQFGYDAVLAWWKPGEPWTAATANRDWHVADTASQVSKPDNIQRRHPCPRPADQVQHIIEQWVRPGSVILDPFAGSGTTVIAAEMSGRRCTAIEVSPVYCDIIVTRWEQFSGKEAMRHVE